MMPDTHSVALPDRGVVAVNGADAAKLLQGLITNDLDRLERQPALHAGLLTPQGKILFAFFVVKGPDGFLLETERGKAAELAKRLTFYKLRAAVKIEDVSQQYQVAVCWRSDGVTALPSPTLPREGEERVPASIIYPDPRHPRLGVRLLAVSAGPRPGGEAATSATPADYDAHRIALGVPDAERDYLLGDTFPHEADFDLFAGADFDKGCFVGQEVVARMQHKTVVRKRVVRVSAADALPAGHPDITTGAATIGRLGSTAGRQGLALIRLDRAAEAIDRGERILAGDAALTVDADAMAAYRSGVAGNTGAP